MIDPRASFTLEYLDMIMTIRANRWKVLFVPTARLEFRITEFSWRDIPYFMYKRSEATAHGTRDYLVAKWRANFPNTGFWTYIKYTIVEQHVYSGSELSSLRWKDQALLVFGFFQMAGYNRYELGGRRLRPWERAAPSDFIDVLERLDGGWVPRASVRASRTLARPEVGSTRPSHVEHLDEILPYGKDSAGPQAALSHEYLPFAMAKLTVATCAQLTHELEAVCGMIIEHADSCACWLNMPTFKSNSVLIRMMARLAARIKVPARITTFAEMLSTGSRNATDHVAPLRGLEGESFSISTCDIDVADCSLSFAFGEDSRLKLFRGAPSTVADVQQALESSS